jgi:hypothetical protein
MSTTGNITTSSVPPSHPLTAPEPPSTHEKRSHVPYQHFKLKRIYIIFSDKSHNRKPFKLILLRKICLKHLWRCTIWQWRNRYVIITLLLVLDSILNTQWELKWPHRRSPWTGYLLNMWRSTPEVITTPTSVFRNSQMRNRHPYVLHKSPRLTALLLYGSQSCQ